MKHLLLILPLAACGPHVYVKGDHHVEMDHSDNTDVLDHALDTGVDGSDHDGGSSDDNGDVSDE